MPLDASTMLPGGILLMDEPESVALATFAANGEVIMTINARPGGHCGQIILGLTPRMAMQLLDMLHKYDDVYAQAVAAGKGGAKFRTKEKT